MAAQLQQEGKLDDWARKAGEKAKDEYAQSVENGMQPLEAESEAKKSHFLYPSEEEQPNLGESPEYNPDPASLVTTPGVNRRKKRPQKENALRPS
jgi:hypothetical protein